MKIAIAGANTAPFVEPDSTREFVTAADEAGIESIWTVEHVIWPTEYGSTYPYHSSGKMPGSHVVPIPDPLMWLAWVAGITSRVRLGTGVLIMPQRNPLLLAKEVATLDAMSGGRLELGVGVGWLREEYDAIGEDFSTRGKKADEMLEAMGALWTEESVTYRGDLVSFESVATNPKPVQSPLPVVVGGKSRAAARRAARFGTGFFVGPGSLDELESLLGVVAEECEKVGRSIDELEISSAWPGRVMEDPGRAIEELSARGVDRMMVDAFRIVRSGLDPLLPYL